LLGTRFTMEEDFYRGRLSGEHGLEVLTPVPEDRETVHRVIYEELCLGRIRDESRMHFRRIVQNLVSNGVEGVVLGCTEIGLLLHSDDVTVLLFDTAEIHAEEAALHALSYGADT
jgi:aspartate racemase